MVDIFAIFLGLISIGLGMWEVLAYRRKKTDAPEGKKSARKRLVRRMVGAVLLLIAVGMVLVDNVVLNATENYTFILVYWGVGLLCALGVFVVVIIDIKKTTGEMLVDHQKIIVDALKLHDRHEKTNERDTSSNERTSQTGETRRHGT